MPDDLWGDLPEPDTAVLPSMILQEQASMLAAKTQNVLEGLVQKRKQDNGGVTLDFFIRCPAVDNYTFHVLRLAHDLLKVYPFKLEGIAKSKGYVVTDANCLREALKDQLQSFEVRRVVSALLREATSAVA